MWVIRKEMHDLVDSYICELYESEMSLKTKLQRNNHLKVNESSYAKFL